MDFPILETDRLILREWEERDASDLFAFYSKEHVLRYTPIRPHLSEADSRATIVRFRNRYREQNSGIVWAIEQKESGKVIGETAVNKWYINDRRAEIGYSFSPDVWGQGIASEAVARIIHYLFDEFSQCVMNRLEAVTDPENTASIKLLQKVGFLQEGLLREREFEKGKFIDSVMFGLLRSDLK